MKPFELDAAVSSLMPASMAGGSELKARLLRERESAFKRALFTRPFFLLVNYTFTGVNGETATAYTVPVNRDLIITGVLTNNATNASNTIITNAATKDSWSIDPVPTSSLMGHRFGSFGTQVQQLEKPHILRANARLIVQTQNASTGAGTYWVVFQCLRVEQGYTAPGAGSEVQDILDGIRAGRDQRDYKLIASIPFTNTNGERVTGRTRPVSVPLLITGVTADFLNSQLQIGDTSSNYQWSETVVPVQAVSGYAYDAVPYIDLPRPFYLPANSIIKIDALQNATGATDNAPANVIFKAYQP